MHWLRFFALTLVLPFGGLVATPPHARIAGGHQPGHAWVTPVDQDWSASSSSL